MSATAPPMCRICKHAHWTREGHIFYVTVKRGQGVPRKKKAKKRKGHE